MYIRHISGRRKDGFRVHRAKPGHARREALLECWRPRSPTLNWRRRKAKEKDHTKAICALRSHTTLGELECGELRIERASVHEEEKLDGKYLVSTTDIGLPAEGWHSATSSSASRACVSHPQAHAGATAARSPAPPREHPGQRAAVLARIVPSGSWRTNTGQSWSRSQA